MEPLTLSRSARVYCADETDKENTVNGLISDEIVFFFCNRSKGTNTADESAFKMGSWSFKTNVQRLFTNEI